MKPYVFDKEQFCLNKGQVDRFAEKVPAPLGDGTLADRSMVKDEAQGRPIQNAGIRG